MIDPEAPALINGFVLRRDFCSPLMLSLVVACGGSADPPIQRSKDRQTKACGMTLVIIAIMPIYVLGTQLDSCNH